MKNLGDNYKARMKESEEDRIQKSHIMKREESLDANLKAAAY